MTRMFGISDVVFLLDAKVLRLNKLLVRPKIRGSLPGGGVRGKRLRFTLQDVCRLGLALWLFRVGLRFTEVEAVLDQKAAAALLGPLVALEAIRTESEQRRFLVTWKVYAAGKSKRVVKLADERESLAEALADRDTTVISLGARLAELGERLEQRYLI